MSMKVQLNGHQSNNPIRGYTIIDDEDFERVNGVSWSLSAFGYAVGGHSPQLKLHRLILNAPKGLQVDHKNGNRLDNRKENLRLCKCSENVKNRKLGRDNTSGYKGIYYLGTNPKAKKKWQSRIRFNGKRFFLGVFDKKEDAARAYNNAALKYHGEFAKTNTVKG